MSTLLGMDVAGGRQAAQQMNVGADEILSLAQRLTTALDSFEWHGPDAQRSRGEWQSTYVTGLNQAAEAVRSYATMIERQAQEQEAASAQ